MLFTLLRQFSFFKTHCTFLQTCVYFLILRMVLAYGELLLTVSAEILFSLDQHCGMAANANILGNSSKPIKRPWLFFFLFVFGSLPIPSPLWINRCWRRVGKLWITPSSSSSEVSHLISIFLNMILVKCRREKKVNVHFFNTLI